jgi:hypothetical protein
MFHSNNTYSTGMCPRLHHASNRARTFQQCKVATSVITSSAECIIECQGTRARCMVVEEASRAMEGLQCWSAGRGLLSSVLFCVARRPLDFNCGAWQSEPEASARAATDGLKAGSSCRHLNFQGVLQCKARSTQMLQQSDATLRERHTLQCHGLRHIPPQLGLHPASRIAPATPIPALLEMSSISLYY